MEGYEPGKGNETINSIIDDLQMSFKCCGSANASDWTNLNKTIPNSCCSQVPSNASDISTTVSSLMSSLTTSDSEGRDVCPKDKIFEKGCVETIRDKMIAYCNPIGGVLLTIGLIQLLGVIFSCVFAHSIKGGYQVV